MCPDVVLTVGASTTEAEASLDTFRANIGQLSGLVGQLGGPFTDVSNIMAGFAVGGPAGAGIAAIGSIGGFINSSVDAASDAEQVWARLSATIQRSGGNMETLKPQLEAVSKGLAKTTTFDDEQIADAINTMMNFGISAEDVMKLVGTATDFAVAKQMDLNTAATLVGKATMGNASLLKRYGVDIKDVGKETDKYQETIAKEKAELEALTRQYEDSDKKDKTLQETIKQKKRHIEDLEIAMKDLTTTTITVDDVMTALNEQFGGAAAAQAETYAGSIQQVKNTWEDLQETVGVLVLPVLTGIANWSKEVIEKYIQPAIDKFAEWLKKIQEDPTVKAGLDQIKKAMGEIWDELDKVMKKVDELGQKFNVDLPSLAKTGLNMLGFYIKYWVTDPILIALFWAEKLLDVLNKIASWHIGAFAGGENTTTTTTTTTTGTTSTGTTSTGTTPRMIGYHAQGGIAGLHGPELSWLGEEGPEAVVPLNKLGQQAPSITIYANYEFTGPVKTELDWDELSRRMNTALAELLEFKYGTKFKMYF